jgi:hypothetical protein
MKIYHEEMDGKSFEEWFAKVLPCLEVNTVIVMYYAPYHTILLWWTRYQTCLRRRLISRIGCFHDVPYEDNYHKL